MLDCGILVDSTTILWLIQHIPAILACGNPVFVLTEAAGCGIANIFRVSCTQLTSLPPLGRQCSTWLRQQVPSLLWNSRQTVFILFSIFAASRNSPLSSSPCAALPGKRCLKGHKIVQAKLPPTVLVRHACCHRRPGCQPVRRSCCKLLERRASWPSPWCAPRSSKPWLSAQNRGITARLSRC